MILRKPSGEIFTGVARSKADFADYLIERSSVQAGCDRTMTFDREAAKSGGMILIH